MGEYDSSFKGYIESIGILEDINELEKQRIKQKEAENKIVAIIPKDYIPFHYANSFDIEEAKGATRLYGFVLHKYIYTEWRVFGLFNWDVVAGSSNVLFVREDRYKHSTLSHELGHTLGQRGKEFYDPKYKCRDFKYDFNQGCLLYRIRVSEKSGFLLRGILSKNNTSAQKEKKMKKGKIIRRKYDTEFKIDAVKLAEKIGTTKAAQKLDIPLVCLQRWKSKKNLPVEKSHDVIRLQAEVKRLKHELHQEKAVVTLLKKATAFFSKEELK